MFLFRRPMRPILNPIGELSSMSVAHTLQWDQPSVQDLFVVKTWIVAEDCPISVITGYECHEGVMRVMKDIEGLKP